MINTKLPKRDDAELERLLAYVKANPKNHLQSMWYIHDACGTTGCLAGHKAVTFDGLQPTNDWGAADMVYDKNGREVSMEMYAREALGLTDREANVLFFSTDEGFEQAAKNVMNDAYRPGGEFY